MRFAVTAVLFIIAMFSFFIGYAVSSFVLDSFYDALEPHANQLSTSNAKDDMILIKTGFGVICSFISVLIIVVFILDTLSDEPEMYWRE
jgi:Na+/proline symporter